MDKAIDPDILAQRRRRQMLAVLGVLTAFAASAWAVNRFVRPSVAADDIMVAEVRKGSVADTISASGLVVPVHEEQIPSPTPSRIARPIAKPGQAVRKDDVLLELDDRATRLAIEGIKEQLAQQENRIVSLSQELEQKRKQLASAIELLELDLQSARAKVERNNKLRAYGGVSAEDMLTAELNVKRLEVQLRQQRELIDDTRRSTGTSIDGARLQKAILQKQLDQQQQTLAQLQVRAPFDGIVTWLAEDTGAAVQGGQLVARVSEAHNYRVEATLSDFHARSLAAGQQVRLEQGGQVLSGHVLTVLPEIQDGSVKLLVTLDQPDHPILRNKLRVDVQVITEQKSNTLVVANGPAFNGRGPQDGFIVRGATAYKTTLDIGSSDGKLVEIRHGAQAGDRIIVSSIARFKQLDTIRISP